MNQATCPGRAGCPLRSAEKRGGVQGWRMLLVGRSLSHSEPVGAVAHSLGYESESAFSTAYKRVMGGTPRSRARVVAIRA